jgi:hypothetical protein
MTVWDGISAPARSIRERLSGLWFYGITSFIAARWLHCGFHVIIRVM